MSTDRESGGKVSHAMTATTHYLCLEDVLWREYRSFANSIDNLSSGGGQHGDSLEEWVARASLGDIHEEVFESLDVGSDDLPHLFTQLFVILNRG